MVKNKYFAVNMNTTEEPKPENNNSNNLKPNNIENNHKTSPNTVNLKKGIKFNQEDLDKKTSVPNNVIKIENPDELFGEKKEKFTGKDLKYVLVPAIVLIVFCVLNELFLAPFLIDKVVNYVLNGNLNVTMSMGNMQNEELTALAGLIAIVSYVLFSLGLFGFAIYCLYKRVYVKKDIIEMAGKIMLYAFLIGFVIAVIDSFIPVNISEVVVKITTLGLHSMKSFINK